MRINSQGGLVYFLFSNAATHRTGVDGWIANPCNDQGAFYFNDFF